MSEMLYCVKHETMERAEVATYSPNTMIHMVWDANYPDDLDWCEFPQGWATCPSPEPPFDIQLDG